MPDEISLPELQEILDNMKKPLQPHKDGLLGFGYRDIFNLGELGRGLDPGGTVLNWAHDGDHYDVIERSGEGGMMHHRIYKSPY